MSDWKIGDLAVCIRAGVLKCPQSEWMTHRGGSSPTEGTAGRVVEIFPDHGDRTGRPCGCVCIRLDNGTSGITPRFRKIRPDEHEACEPEFVTLLRRTKRKVGANA